MKLQYLGDSKDAFKWDYLDFLAREMCADLHYVPMLTVTGLPCSFPARSEIKGFCRDMQKKRIDMEKQMAKEFYENLRRLPKLTRGSYAVEIYESDSAYGSQKSARKKYFGKIEPESKRIVFLDPDTGFEPKTAKKEHVKFSDVETIWPQISKDSIVVVFQNARRQPFCDVYNEIKERLSGLGHFDSTGLFRDGMAMFATFGKSTGKINQARKANSAYKCMVEQQSGNRKIQLIDVKPKTRTHP